LGILDLFRRLLRLQLEADRGFSDSFSRGLLGNSEHSWSPILDSLVVPGNCHYRSNLCVALERVVELKKLIPGTGWII
jgi:hypothetical protein